MESQTKTCRLCLKECDNSFKAIQGNAQEHLDMLLLKINLAVSETPVMCKNCDDVLKTCYDFKTSCLQTHHFMTPFIDSEIGHVKSDDKDVNLDESGNVNVSSVSDECDACKLCRGPLNSCSLVSLEIDEKHVMLMIKKCFPELDLRTIRKPVICERCSLCLQDYFSLITNCTLVEEDVKEYCESAGIVGTCRLKLKNVLKFRSKDMYEEDGNKIEEDVKHKREYIETDDKNFSKEMSFISSNLLSGKDNEMVDKIKIEVMHEEEEECEIKLEHENITEMEYQSLNDVLQLPSIDKANCEGSLMIDRIKMESNCEERPNEVEIKNELQDSKFLPRDVEEIEKKIDPQDFDRSQESPIFAQLDANVNTSETRKYTRRKRVTGKTIHQCDYCTFQTKYRKSLVRHMSNHKDPSEVTIHSCFFCKTFHSKYKEDVANHVALTHKHPTEIGIFICTYCSYKTKLRQNLKAHLLTHKNPSEVTMHQCDSCPFQTKFKGTLVRHMITHKEAPEIKIYQCEFCTFQTKHKYGFVNHMLTHKDPSEITMYRCEYCPYQAARRKYLTSHLLTHKSPSEIKMYRCDSCSLQTKFKRALVKHMLTHKKCSKVKVYHCKSCDFQSKLEADVVAHMSIHEDPLGTPALQCEYCSYRTNNKQYLKQHILTHKSSSEVTMYQCESCSFQTKYKRSLAKHALIHKNPSDTATYQCESCSYKTKYKQHIERHILKCLHK